MEPAARHHGARLLVLMSALVAIIAFLVGTGHGLLASPPTSDWPSASSWYAEVGPVVAAMAGLRVVALILAAWLLAIAALELACALPGLHPLGPVVAAITPRSLRRLVQALAGISLTAGLAVPAPSAGLLLTSASPPGDPITTVTRPDVPAQSGVATMRVLPDDERSAGPPSPAAPVPTTPARRDPLRPPLTTTTSAAPATADRPGPVPAPGPSPSPRAAPSPPGSVIVQPGDSFWSIAEDALQRRSGGPVAARRVAEYWRALIDLNRGQLADPSNPDLIFPGQQLVLPER